MISSAPIRQSPWVFFLLVFVLSVPVWLISQVTGPPLSVLNAFNPLVAASILLYRERGLDEVKALLKRSVDFGKIKEKVWYGPIFGLLPLTYILAFGGMTFSGKTLPESQVPLLLAPVFLAVFFVLAVGEEVGWMGYAFDPLRRRWNALTTL